MPTLLNGTELSLHWQRELSLSLPRFERSLVIVQVGDDPASTAYINQKIKLFESLTVPTRVRRLPLPITTKQLLKVCEELNNDLTVGGYLVQLPLPGNVDVTQVCSAIALEKDVDGLNPLNLGSIWNYQHYGRLPLTRYLNRQTTRPFPFTIPATVVGILYLLKHIRYPLRDKRVVIINKSPIVGSPLAAVLLSAGAQVTLMSSRSKQKDEHLQHAQVVMSAVGKAGWLTSSAVPLLQLGIDIGISRTPVGLRGDFDLATFASSRAKITPVPGGIGPLTVMGLFYNFVRVCSF